MSSVPIFFQGDLMLLRWNENDTSGRTVTFQLDECEVRHPFKGQKKGATNGQRYKAVLVAIGPDEEPVNATPTIVEHAAQPQPQPEAQRSAPNLPVLKGKSFRDMPRSQQAALKCQDLVFCDWIESAVDHSLDHAEFLDEESYARAILKEHLGITSRKELDTMPNKAGAWDKLLASFETETRYGVK